MNPTVFLATEVEVVTKVAAVDGVVVIETMEETGLMDRCWWWRQEGWQNWTSCKWTWCPKKEVGGELLRLG